MCDKKQTEELSALELDQVTGGVAHELSHTVQQGSNKFAVSTAATPKEAASAQYNPETITRTVAPHQSTAPTR